MPLAELLLDVAAWAGVDIAQVRGGARAAPLHAEWGRALQRFSPALRRALATAACRQFSCDLAATLPLASPTPIPSSQSADFGEAFLALRPNARLLWYRRLRAAASAQVRGEPWAVGEPGRMAVVLPRPPAC